MSGRVVAIPVDGSEHANFALDFYVKNVRAPGDKVVLLHVPQLYSLTDASPGVINDLVKKMMEAAEKVKNQYEDKLKQLGVEGEVKISMGEAGEQLCHLAAKSNATYIVMGSRGLGKIRRTLMGSVSDYVLHHAGVPVLICRPPTSK